MSEIKGKQLLWIVAAVLAFAAYFLLAAHPLRREPGLRPVWAIDLAKDAARGTAAVAGDAALSGIPFKMGGRMGYFSSEGRVLFSAESGPGSAIDQYAYAARDPGNGRTRFSSPQGAEILTTRAPAFPLAGAGRFLALSSEGQSIAEYGRDGKELWERAFPSVLTAIDVKGSSIAAGCLDGSVVVLGAGGKESFRFMPGGSRIQAVYGIALSDDERALAVVSGADPQRFLYLERKSGEFKVVYHAFLKSDYRREIAVRFSARGASVFFEQDGGLAAFDVRERRISSIPVLGRVAALGLGSGGGPLAFLSDSGRGLLLSVHRPAAMPRLRAGFPGTGHFLAQDGKMLFVGSGRALVRLDAGDE